MEFVLGRPREDQIWEAAIVLQGPYKSKYTPTVIRMFLERNDPNFLIIVSTYMPSQESIGEELCGTFLSSFEKSIVLPSEENPYTGRLVYLFLRLPDKNEEREFWRTNYWNQNLQRYSSFVGLEYAHDLGIEKALKCRCDAFLGMHNVCRYFSRELVESVPIFPVDDTHLSRLRGRIVTGDFTKVQSENMRVPELGEYHIMDFWLFGYTTDLMTYFDLREGSFWNRGSGIRTDLTVETHLAELWMKEIGISQSQVRNVLELVGRYMAIADSVKVEFVLLRPGYHHLKSYMTHRVGYLRRAFRAMMSNWRFVTHSRWKQEVEKYARARS